MVGTQLCLHRTQTAGRGQSSTLWHSHTCTAATEASCWDSWTRAPDMGATSEGWLRGPGGGSMTTMTMMGKGMMACVHGVLVDDRGCRCGTVASAAPSSKGNSDGCKSTARAWGGASPSSGGWHGERQRSRTVVIAAAVWGCNDDNEQDWRCDGRNSIGGGGSGGLVAAAGWRKRKIFPLSHLANNDQDKLHVEI